MRFVYINELKAGMTLARNLYGKRGELLLARGSVLTNEIISKLIQQGLDGVYVSDESSDDSNLKGIISTRLKENTVRAVRNFFIGIDQGHKEVISVSLSAIRGLIDDIIDEISLDKNAVVNMIDIKNFDDYTYDHCVSVGALAIMVGVSAGMNRRGLYRLGMGALLHDIGKIFVPKEIVNKKGILTYDEYEIMKKHSEYGCEYLKRQDAVPLESSIAVLTHHERFDGKGYPLGLASNKQPIEGKIISICDNFDALTSDRPYGMPKVAYEIGGVEFQSPLQNIPQLIINLLNR